MKSTNNTISPWQTRPGRAAVSNLASRFEPYQREVVSDGWELEETATVARTEVTEEVVRKIIVRNTSPDLGFDRSLNIYRGCEHGCIYCFARPTHAFLGLSAGLDFETKLVCRPNAADALTRELATRSYKVRPIAIGTNTDPYQPIESRYRLMAKILDVLDRHNHPVTITTKGSLIERDIKILSRMAERNLVQVGISVTSLDLDLSRKLEPRAPAPKRRLATIKRLCDAGIPVRVMVAPIVPGLTDHEIEKVLEQSADAGAKLASWIMLRLPGETKDLMSEWLDEHFPNKKKKIMGRLAEMHGGQLYNAEFGQRMTGEGPYSQLIGHRFKLAARSLGLNLLDRKLDCTQFLVPGRGEQYSLF